MGNCNHRGIEGESDLVGTKIISLEQDSRSRVPGIGECSLDEKVQELGLMACSCSGCSVVGDCDVLVSKGDLSQHKIERIRIHGFSLTCPPVKGQGVTDTSPNCAACWRAAICEASTRLAAAATVEARIERVKRMVNMVVKSNWESGLDWWKSKLRPSPFVLPHSIEYRGHRFAHVELLKDETEEWMQILITTCAIPSAQWDCRKWNFGLERFIQSGEV